MTPTPTVRRTRPANVDLVLGVVVLATLCTLRALIAAFLLKTLEPWRHQ